MNVTRDVGKKEEAQKPKRRASGSQEHSSRP